MLSLKTAAPPAVPRPTYAVGCGHFKAKVTVVAECGTGKTLIALGAIHVHSQGSPFTALAMVPPHLVEKWAREAFLTLPGIRVFLIDDLRNGGDENKSHGVNEVRLRQGRIVREGLHTTLSELRLRKDSPSSRKRWLSLCGRPSLFIVGRERAKLGYFWRHAYRVPHSGPYVGCIVNSDTGKPVIVDESRLTAGEFEKVKIAETIETRGEKSCPQPTISKHLNVLERAGLVMRGFAALADPTRRAILARLASGEVDVSELMKPLLPSLSR